MSVLAESLAVDALARWLRLKLPAKVAEVNLLRKPALRSCVAGPFTVPASASLKINLSGKDAAYTTVALTAGVGRTATQVAAEISAGIAGLGGTCPVDAASDTFAITGVAPSSATQGVYVGPDSTGANELFGWDPGGESNVISPIVAPNHRAVMDGWPHQLDVAKTSAGHPFIVVIGRRKGRPVAPETRKDETVVTLELALFRPAAAQENHRSREHMHACLQCVREVLLTDAGRQLGRASVGDVVLVQLGDATVEAMRFQQVQAGRPFGPQFDSASLQLFVQVFERPAAS